VIDDLLVVSPCLFGKSPAHFTHDFLPLLFREEDRDVMFLVPIDVANERVGYTWIDGRKEVAHHCASAGCQLNTFSIR
jgi:hypothetical protein